MKKTLLLLFSLALSLTACQNTEELTGEINNNTPKFTLKAVIDNGDDDADATRTIVGNDGYTKWEAGDEIDVMKRNTADVLSTYTFTVSELHNNNDTAKFTTSDNFQLDDTYYNSHYVAVYPSGKYDGDWFPFIDCTIDSVQTYKAGNMVASKCNPAIAVEEKTAFEANQMFHFKNIFGLLRLKFKGNNTIKAIRFKTNSQPVSGVCKFAPLDIFDVIAWSTEYKTVKLDCGMGVALDATTDSIFYIVLPPATYNGFAIEAEDVDGYKRTYTSSKDHIIQRSKIHTIASLTFNKREGVWYNINNTGWVFWGTSTTLPAKATAGTFALKTDEGFTFSAAQMAAVNNFVKTSAGNGSILVDMNDAVYIDTIMPANAFSGNSKIKTFAIPKNIKALGEYAFNGCTYLSGISNTEQIDSLGKFCFHKCGSLKTFPTFNVTRYPQSCFMYCGFTEVVVPEGVTYLGQECLKALPNITKLYLPSTVDTIYQSALGGNEKLANLYCRAMVAPVTDNFTSTTVFNSATFNGNNAEGISYMGKAVTPTSNRVLHVPDGATKYDGLETDRKDWKTLLDQGENTGFKWTINYDL